MTNQNRLLQKTIQEFQQELLSSNVASHIMKIIHFGGSLKRKWNKNSDIDIMVVSSNGKEVEERVAEIAFTLQMENGIGIEPMVENLDEIIWGRDYFLYNVSRYGKEIYSMKKRDLKKEAGRNLYHLAQEYLDSALDALNNGHVRLAVDAAYNAAELGAKALILKKVDDLPGSHGGVIGRFGQLYIKNGPMDKSLGRNLNQALELRNSARYKYQVVINRNDAQWMIDLTKVVLKEVDKIIK